MPTHAPGALILGSDFKALAVARSLDRRGIKVAVVDNLPRSAWFSRSVHKRFRWRSPMSGPAFLEFLIGLARHHAMQGWVLIPAQDEALEAVARGTDSLSAAYRLVTQPWGTLKWAHDKRLLHAVAAGAQVAHPTTWYPESEEDLGKLDLRYPAIVKPTMSVVLQYRLGRKALRASDPEGLRHSYRRVAEFVPADEILIQEMVPAEAQYSVAAFCEDGAVLAAMTARRTRQYPMDFGLSSSFVEAVFVPGLIEAAQRLLRRLGTTGMVEVEFVQDRRDGKLKLLDVNPRPWGWHSLCTACGLDMAWMHYAYAFGRRPGRVAPVYGRRWIRLMTDLPAGLQGVRMGMFSPGGYLRSLWGETVYSVFDWRDPMSAIGDLAVALWRVALPRRGRGRAMPALVDGGAAPPLGVRRFQV